MHLLTSNFNLLHSNSNWNQLKKHKFIIDENYNHFYLLFNRKDILEKYETIHIVLNFDDLNKNELIKKLSVIRNRFSKLKNIFLYFTSSLNKKKTEKLFLFIEKKINLNNSKIINSQLIDSKILKFNKRNGKYIKFPFEINTIETISKIIIFDLKVYNSKPYKLLVIDCDNTLWGGVLDEEGVRNLKYGNKDIGLIYKNFQIFLKSLKNKGFVLSLSSKNNEKQVWEAMKIRKMELQKKDFISPKINWLEKDINIKKTLNNLSLRAEDTLFIDDNIIEIEKVQSSIKSINCIKFDIKTIFNNLNNDLRLKKFKVLKEDKIKYKQYNLKSNFENLKEKKSKKIDNLMFLKSLKQKVKFINFNKLNFDRALQLIHKTNQFNLSLNRYSHLELKKVIKHKKFSTKLIGFKDKFGDHGIIGLYICKKDKHKLMIIDFLLSCRVLYRGIEDYMIYRIMKSNVNKKVLINYKPSLANNKLSPLFLQKDFFKIFEKKNNEKIYEINFNKTLDETKKIFN